MKAIALLLVLVACSEGRKPEARREPERQRRVIEPPTRGVRALPPHAIRADGVGPYKLGATVTQLLDELPSGPRITQFQLPDLIQRDILRAEDDAILIGTEPQGRATFVSVVRADIARTETGVHVGSSRAELEQALGASVEELDRASDPRIVIPRNLRNARVLLDPDDRISAFVITSDAEKPKEATGEPRNADEVQKAIAALRLPGLVFAAALRNPSDGRDDIVAVTRTDDAQKRTWSVAAYRFHDNKLARVIEPYVAYELTATNARWIGADISDLELYLELMSRADSIEVGGLMTTRVDSAIRDIVVISPTSVPRRRAKPVPHEVLDAGTAAH